MELRRRLLLRLLSENPFQPATSWWRAIELAALIDHGLPAGHGLDLGCGDGKLMRILLDASATRASLVGVDIDPLETRDATASGTYQRVHTASGARIPEADASFDFVFSNSVLEHIDEIEPVMAEVARLLRPAGRFIFTVPSAGLHACLAGPLLPWVRREDYLRQVDRRCAHRRYWSEAQWQACLERHGLVLARALPYLTASETQRWESLARFSSGALYLLFGKRLQPIEIQRSLGLRKPGLRLPHALAASLGAALSAGVGADASGRSACLLVDARKPQ